MIKKLKIDQSFENVYVWGISSAIADLKLVLLINRHLHIELQRSICVMNRTLTPPEGFQTFTYLDEEEILPVRYVLFVNKVEGYSLFTSCVRFDYLWVMIGSFSEHELKRTEIILRSIDGINAFIPISIDRLKNDKEYLMLFE